MRFLAALSNNDWIVGYDDLIIIQDEKGAASSMAFRSMASVNSDSKKQKLVSLIIIRYCKENTKTCFVCRNIVRNQGKWKDSLVAIKMINKDTIPLTTPLRLEIKAMRDIRHNNLAQFIGACHEAPNICILMEIAPKVCTSTHLTYCIVYMFLYGIRLCT